MEQKKTEEKEELNLFVGILALVVILAAIVTSIKLNFGTQMSVFVGAVVAVAIAMILKTKWADIQKALSENITSCIVALLIFTLVGILVGVWLIGGTLPSLIYYGLQIISPKAIVPITFLLCGMTSVFTGTSFGCIATMGLAMYGVGINMGIPGSLLAGAIVSGAYFGDKMSPMSDTTNLAPAMSGTDLYSHIGSMMYTTIPATVISLILYIVLGIQYASSSYDTTGVNEMKDTLLATFNISPICLIPLVLVLVLSVLKVPAVLAMGSSAVVSIILAALTQNVALSEIMGAAMNGYSSVTGVATVDTILSRGGIKSMAGTIAIVFFSSIMAGALKSCGILDIFSRILQKVVHSAGSLVVSTLVFCWGISAITGNQAMGIIIPGKTMGDMYDKMDVNRKVLSRSLEDAATIGAPLIPWSSAGAYVTGVLGIGFGYIPYSFLCYIVPVFSIICAFTGIGMWNSKGEKFRRKKMSGANTNEA